MSTKGVLKTNKKGKKEQKRCACLMLFGDMCVLQTEPFLQLDRKDFNKCNHDYGMFK